MTAKPSPHAQSPAAEGAARYTVREVVFSRPFTLGASPDVYPAGTYKVETAEEAVEGNEHTAHVRTSTVLIIPTRSGTVHRTVRGSDLDQAIVQDLKGDGLKCTSENPDRGKAD